MSSRTIASAISALALVAFAPTPSFADYARDGNLMPVGALVTPPAGVLGFCVHHLDECTAVAAGPATVELTVAREHELADVQDRINAAIEPREDPTHAWEYPTNGYGDCNKYALAKRRELIALGWPREALLLTVATTEHGEGHLVLVVTTSRGDLVLDNRMKRVVDWRELPYHWVSRQSPLTLTKWVSLASPTSSGLTS